MRLAVTAGIGERVHQAEMRFLVEPIDLQPLQQLAYVLKVVVNECFVAHGKTTRGQRREPIGDGQQRVALAQLKEGPRATAVLGRDSAPSTSGPARKLVRAGVSAAAVVLIATGGAAWWVWPSPGSEQRPPRAEPAVAARGRCSKGRSCGGGVVVVQLSVLWQVPQSRVVCTCWACLPVAVMPFE